jgi:hypothetical protein
MKQTRFTRFGPSGHRHSFECENVVFGIPINPVLPPEFDDTPNELRDDRSLSLWDLPFVVGQPGTAWCIRRLDGGAWDRSTWCGQFKDQSTAAFVAFTLLIGLVTDQGTREMTHRKVGI